MKTFCYHESVYDSLVVFKALFIAKYCWSEINYGIEEENLTKHPNLHRLRSVILIIYTDLLGVIAVGFALVGKVCVLKSRT